MFGLMLFHMGNLADVTPSNLLLHPLLSFKFKDLVAKQHPTNVCYLVESTAVYILYTTLLHNNVTPVHNYISVNNFYIHSNNVEMNILC